jgi:hypothetical protein
MAPLASLSKVLTEAARAVRTTESPSPNPLRKLLELIASQIAELEEQLKLLYDDLFVETEDSVRFGDGAIGAPLPTGEEQTSRRYGSCGGDRGNLPPDSAVTLLELLARAADVLAEMQDRVAEEGYLGTARVRRSRRRRRVDLPIVALVGIAAWLAWRCRDSR